MNEHGEVLAVLMQQERDIGAAKHFFKRLLDNQDIPEQVVTDTLFRAQVGSGAMVPPSEKYPPG